MQNYLESGAGNPRRVLGRIWRFMRVLLFGTPTYTHTHPVVLLLCLLLPPLHSRKSADSVFPVVRDGGMQLFLLCTGTTVERLRTTYRHSMETHGGKNTKRSSSKWMVKF